jgi:O-antigen/teichoic acid export membrane protein
MAAQTAPTSRAADVYNVPRGTAYLTTQQFVTYTVYLIFYIALARILSQKEVGQISLLLAAQTAFAALTQLGLPSAATRFISGSIGKDDRRTGGSVARTVLRISVGVAGAGLAIAALISPLVGPAVLGSSDAGNLLILTFISGLLLDLILVYGAFFIGVGAYARSLYQNALYIPLSRGLGLLLAYVGYRVMGIVLGWVIGGLVTLLLSIYLWHGRLPSHSSYPVEPLLAFSLPVFGSALIGFGQQYGDITILQAVLGQLSTTGAYYLIVSSVSFLSILWIPVTQALYPALSASHATGGTEAVSKRLAVAFRLTNLAVLPFGAALAAIAPTAIDLIYGPAYVSQAGIFAALALATIFTAQAVILTTSLQAMGRARQVLVVTLVSTAAGLLVVATTARLVGTLGGVLGRTVLGASTVILARRSLASSAQAHTENALPTALLLAVGVGIPLAIVDDLLIGHLSPFRRLPILVGVFVLAFLAISRTFRIFRASDFAILKDALPRRFHSQLRAVEHLVVGKQKRRDRGLPVETKRG